ncbi:MAG TPA: hypothetical protein VGR54_02990 [Nitrosopumilaceae archaeon]|nr:hypothetical protein [Nitrosopumilaceae archaeon]
MTIEGLSPISINRRLLFLGIFLTSLSGLVLEIAITRIFSAAIWYHFAFVAVSVALLGLGASGLFVQFRTKRIKGNWAGDMTVFSGIGITILTPIALFTMHILSSHITYLPLFMFLFAMPFFFVGIIISTAFNAFAAMSGRLYSADLIGASLGALIVVLLLTTLGGEETTLSVGLISAIAATIFSVISKAKKKTIMSLAFVGFAASLLFINYSTQIFAIQTDPYVQKDLPIYLREHPGSKIVKTQWNSFSRIDVVEGGSGDGGLVAKIFIDGGAGTNIMSWDGDLQSRQDLSGWMQYLPFKMMENPKILVIGSGGGRDVVAALVSGSKDVTSVEINPIIYHTVESYGDKAGNVYHHQYVGSYIDEGRSFVTRSTEKYDIIYIPFVDTWASVSSGGLSVSENFLYTMEGFQQYYDHLTDKGKIVAVRWLIDSPRFVSTFTQLLEKNGIPQTEVSQHLIIVTTNSYEKDPSVTMVIFSKAPFTADEIKFFSDSFAQKGYKPILVPGQTAIESYSALLSDKISLKQFYDLFPTKVYPVTDDNPFFLSFEKPLPIILEGLLYGSLVIVGMFLVVPLAWLRKSKPEKSGLRLVSIVPYFASLGMGFILIELSLMQKLILLLGNPTTTLAILLFTLLVSSGAGSLFSSRIMKNNSKNLVFVISGIAVLGIFYAISLAPMIYSVIAQPLELKAVIAVGLLAPIGFLMGMPMPTGMRLVKSHSPVYVPWMWAINGAFSALGAVLSVTIAILVGASWALMLGIIIYFIALGISFSWKKKPISELQPTES